MANDETGHERAHELPEDLRPLARYERPSGAPFVPSPGAPATHTGRPAQHSGVSDQRIVMCPMSAVTPGVKQCPFIGAVTQDAVRDHLRTEHNWQVWLIDNYLADPWYADEPRSAWKERTFHLRYGLNREQFRAVMGDNPPGFTEVTRVQDSVVLKPINEKNIPQLRCPVSIDCAYSTLPPTFMRKHLINDHGWSMERADDWLEEVGANPLTIPAELKEAMAERERVRQEMEKFMDPQISTEELVGAISPELAEKLDAMTPSQLEALLTEWWMDKAEEEVRRTVPKAVEYGALDLIQIGQDLALTAGRTVTDEEAAELGVYFYVRGKLARWTDAIVRGDRVSDDTLFDLGVYIRMAQRIRDAGGWPGLPK